MENENEEKYKNIYKFINQKPNFKYEKYIEPMNDYCNGFIGFFDIFTYNKDNNQYIIIPGVNSFLIYLIRITDSHLLTSLKGHNECLSVLNYFQNSKNKNEEYILSADIKGILILWDIKNNFKIKYKINTKEHVIFSSIILFNANNINNYIITSNNNSDNDSNNYSKIYSLSNGKFLKNIKNTNLQKTYYILPWYDKQNILYIIECCYEKITVINLEKNDIYYEFLSEGETETFTFGLTYNKDNKDILCSLSMHGDIKFWDLENKVFIRKIKSGGINLRVMLQWSEEYFILADNKYNNNNTNKTFKILDIDQFKIISNIGGKHKSPITCIKKIKHNTFGDIIITGETGKSLIVWSLK